MHHDTAGTLFAIANLIIVAGYLAVPLLVLPYLPLSRAVLIAGVGFFLGCAGTHAWMAASHHHTNLWWTAEHVLQAICTWAFILLFRADLRRAHALRTRVRDKPEAAT